MLNHFLNYLSYTSAPLIVDAALYHTVVLIYQKLAAPLLSASNVCYRKLIQIQKVIEVQLRRFSGKAAGTIALQTCSHWATRIPSFEFSKMAVHIYCWVYWSYNRCSDRTYASYDPS